MSTESFRKIEKYLNDLKEPHILGWSFYPYTRDIASEYKNLSTEDRQRAWEDLLKPRLNDRKDLGDLGVVLQICSLIPIPEAKETLLSLLGGKEASAEWRFQFNILTALGRIPAEEARKPFKQYASKIDDQDSNISRVAVAAITALSELDLSEALDYVPTAIRGDFKYRGDLTYSGGGYHRNCDALFSQLLDRHGETAIQPITQQILKMDPQLQEFVRASIDIRIGINDKIIQEFSKARGEEFVGDEKAKQRLLLQLRQALEPIKP